MQILNSLTWRQFRFVGLNYQIIDDIHLLSWYNPNTREIAKIKSKKNSTFRVKDIPGANGGGSKWPVAENESVKHS